MILCRYNEGKWEVGDVTDLKKMKKSELISRVSYLQLQLDEAHKLRRTLSDENYQFKQKVEELAVLNIDLKDAMNSHVKKADELVQANATMQYEQRKMNDKLDKLTEEYNDLAKDYNRERALVNYFVKLPLNT